MLKIIKSYVAHQNWIKAHDFMANQSPDLALTAIKKAIKNEPDKAKLPSYYELKRQIELSFSKKGNRRQK